MPFLERGASSAQGMGHRIRNYCNHMKSHKRFRLAYLDLTLAYSKGQGYGHAQLRISLKWSQIWQTLLLPLNMMSYARFRWYIWVFLIDLVPFKTWPLERCPDKYVRLLVKVTSLIRLLLHAESGINFRPQITRIVYTVSLEMTDFCFNARH